MSFEAGVIRIMAVDDHPLLRQGSPDSSPINRT